MGAEGMNVGDQPVFTVAQERAAGAPAARHVDGHHPRQLQAPAPAVSGGEGGHGAPSSGLTSVSASFAPAAPSEAASVTIALKPQLSLAAEGASAALVVYAKGDDGLLATSLMHSNNPRLAKKNMRKPQMTG